MISELHHLLESLKMPPTENYDIGPSYIEEVEDSPLKVDELLKVPNLGRDQEDAKQKRRRIRKPKPKMNKTKNSNPTLSQTEVLVHEEPNYDEITRKSGVQEKNLSHTSRIPNRIHVKEEAGIISFKLSIRERTTTFANPNYLAPLTEEKYSQTDDVIIKEKKIAPKKKNNKKPVKNVKQFIAKETPGFRGEEAVDDLTKFVEGG